MNELKISLDPRLAAAASFVRNGSVVADIGTDHAFLPIYLILNKISNSAVASDFNKGPLDRAVANAEKYEVSDRIRFVLADGLCGIKDGEVTDIVICGMGGELIEKIIENSDYPKKIGVRLILQPMTFADELRRYLGQNGFNIIGEKLCKSSGKIYTVIAAEYDGITREFSVTELLLGSDKNGELFYEHAEKIIKKLETKIDGKTKGGLDCSEEINCLKEIRKILE